jgi:hypothetical protein
MTVTLLALGAERPAAATVDAALLSSCYAAAALCKHALIGQTCKVGYNYIVLTLLTSQGNTHAGQVKRARQQNNDNIDKRNVCRALRHRLQAASVQHTWRGTQ